MDNKKDEVLEIMAKKIGSESSRRLLSVLGKNKQFYNAISTNAGQELLRDAVKQMESRIEKIVAEEDDLNTRAELRAYRSILSAWSSTINKYKDDLLKFSKLTTGGSQ